MGLLPYYFVLLIETIIALWAILRWNRSAIQQRLVIILLVTIPAVGVAELW